MKILILNSDSPNNRGDRAILWGIIRLLRDFFPAAEIWAISEEAERDSKWFNINFLKMEVHTLNPYHFFRLGPVAKRFDLILWGGGELLKDYTNKLGLIYWVLKITWISLFNKNIFGFYQGIGPTKSNFSKKLIKFVVNRTKTFFVRDEESYLKLKELGVTSPLVSSYDPAIFCKPKSIEPREWQIMERDFLISKKFANESLGVGLRNWFHYHKSSWIPFRYKRMLNLSRHGADEVAEEYRNRLAELLDQIVDQCNLNIIFFPMHISEHEGDLQIAKDVQSRMKNYHRTRVIHFDSLSPDLYQGVIAECRTFIGFRLHSFILAFASLIPSIILYYIDKGRVFADQMQMQKFSIPIEAIFELKTQDVILDLVKYNIANSSALKSKMENMLSQKKKELKDKLREVLSEKGLLE